MSSEKNIDPLYIVSLVFGAFWLLIGLGWMIFSWLAASGPRINPF